MSNTIKRYGVEITINPLQDVEDLFVMVCFRFVCDGRRLVAHVSQEAREQCSDADLARLQRVANEMQATHKLIKKKIGARAARQQGGAGHGVLYTCDRNAQTLLGAGSTPDTELTARMFVTGFTMKGRTITGQDKDKIVRAVDRKYNRIEQEGRNALASIGILLPRKAKKSFLAPPRQLAYGLLDT